jgi:hypothetical protein
MAPFTPMEGEPQVEDEGAAAWIHARLEEARTARSLPRDLEWRIQRGRRDAGPPGGPRLTRTGYLIGVVDQLGGEPRTLTCFLATEDIHDEEQRPIVEQVIALWLDRVFERDGSA